jgi:hypothetical protein
MYVRQRLVVLRCPGAGSGYVLLLERVLPGTGIGNKQKYRLPRPVFILLMLLN